MRQLITALLAIVLHLPAFASTSQAVNCDGCDGEFVNGGGNLSVESPVYDQNGNWTGETMYVRASVAFTAGTCIVVTNELTGEASCLRISGCSAKIGLEWWVDSAFPCDVLGFCLISPNGQRHCLNSGDFPCDDCSDPLTCGSTGSNSNAYTITNTCGDNQRFAITIGGAALPPDPNGNPQGDTSISATVGCQPCDG